MLEVPASRRLSSRRNLLFVGVSDPLRRNRAAGRLRAGTASGRDSPASFATIAATSLRLALFELLQLSPAGASVLPEDPRFHFLQYPFGQRVVLPLTGIRFFLKFPDTPLINRSCIFFIYGFFSSSVTCALLPIAALTPAAAGRNSGPRPPDAPHSAPARLSVLPVTMTPSTAHSSSGVCVAAWMSFSACPLLSGGLPAPSASGRRLPLPPPLCGLLHAFLPPPLCGLLCAFPSLQPYRVRGPPVVHSPTLSVSFRPADCFAVSFGVRVPDCLSGSSAACSRCGKERPSSCRSLSRLCTFARIFPRILPDKALLHPRGQLFHLKIRQFRQCVAEILQGFLPVLLRIRPSSVGINIRVIIGHPIRISSQKLQIVVVRRLVRRKIQRVNIALREQSAGTRRVKPPAGIAGRGSPAARRPSLRLDLKFLSSRIDRHMQLAAACRAEITHEVKIIPDPALSPLAHRDVRPGRTPPGRVSRRPCARVRPRSFPHPPAGSAPLPAPSG